MRVYSEVCEGISCKKRELCKRYIDNHHKYYNTESLSQLIDWSNYGSCMIKTNEDGSQYLEETWDCGDKSVTYPMFESVNE